MRLAFSFLLALAWTCSSLLGGVTGNEGIPILQMDACSTNAGGQLSWSLLAGATVKLTDLRDSVEEFETNPNSAAALTASQQNPIELVSDTSGFRVRLAVASFGKNHAFVRLPNSSVEFASGFSHIETTVSGASRCSPRFRFEQMGGVNTGNGLGGPLASPQVSPPNLAQNLAEEGTPSSCELGRSSPLSNFHALAFWLFFIFAAVIHVRKKNSLKN